MTTFKQRMSDASEPKYQPCPFCGNKDQIEIIMCEEGEHSVRCGKCNADGPLKRYKSLAVKFWNTRRKELAQ